MTILALGASFLLGLLQTATPAATPTNAAPAPPTATTTSLADSPTPTDPKELLELGRKVNGLTGTDVQPWHLRATFEIFDNDGKSKDKGTFEEWWVNDKKYKRSYQSADFSQVEYGTDHGTFLTGDNKPPSGPLLLLRRALVQPLPLQSDIEDWGQRKVERKFGATKLACTALAYKGAKSVDDSSPAYCFEPAKPILRYFNTPTLANESYFDRLLLFRGRYIASAVRLLFLGRPALSIHMERLEALDQLGQPDFLPPASAVAVTKRRVELTATESRFRVLEKATPRYPDRAKMQRVQGEVILRVVIGKDGHTQEVQPLTGPQILQQSAAAAVQQWIYKPYLVDGEPAEVETEAYVVYTLGN